MPSDWKGPFNRRMRTRASERGRRMAARRWALDRERRDQLAALTAEHDPSRILRRIVVIDQERDVRETVIWSWDSFRSARRKIRAALSPVLFSSHAPANSVA
jgi:hypothetical protein